MFAEFTGPLDQKLWDMQELSDLLDKHVQIFSLDEAETTVIHDSKYCKVPGVRVHAIYAPRVFILPYCLDYKKPLLRRLTSYCELRDYLTVEIEKEENEILRNF